MQLIDKGRCTMITILLVVLVNYTYVPEVLA
jgi:hypothetical protein